MSVRLAIDIGGTFTDAILIDEETGAVSIGKVLSTPSDPSEGFLQAAERALAEGAVEAGDVRVRRPRHDRRDQRDHRGQDRAHRLRHDRGLPRRARDRPPDAADAVRHAVRQAGAARAARPCRRRARAARPAGRGARAARRRLGARRGARSCGARASSRSRSACSTPTSTRSTSSASARSSPRSCPGVPISLSSDIAPEFREYLRASTTVINAVIRPVVERYLQGIESRLAEAGRARRSCS